MTHIWASPRDAYPDSVHSLMALWGGFSLSSDQLSDGGLEKRLQFDFRRSDVPSSTISIDDVTAVMSRADQLLLQSKRVREMETATLTQSLVVLTSARLLITSSSSVMLHQVLQPMLSLFQSKGVVVEWASFLRKNLVSPWKSKGCETSDIMAQEYAELKAAFPSGNSFLTGPVDGEHYFHFVYDNVVREEGVNETDAQFNTYLYNVSRGVEFTADKEQHQQLTPLSSEEGGYEMQRVFADSRCVSFETNASCTSFAAGGRLCALLDEFCPEKFTLVMFQDRDVKEQTLRTAFANVDGYKMTNRTINYFSEGYAFHHLNFLRSIQ